VTLSQLPAYVRVPKGATFTPVPLDFGKNIAPEAVFSSPQTGVNEHLNNELFGSFHHGNPFGATFVVAATNWPYAVNFKFDAPREVGKMIVYGVNPDNTACALIDFEVQGLARNGKWATIKRVKNETPPAEMGKTPYAAAYSWVNDTNIFAIPFDKPVTASEFRLLVHSVSSGAISNDPVGWKNWGGPGVNVCIREIEVYGK
jgi:hypothetical protein